jgi:1,3-propanediol dehydrogenase
MLFNLDYCLERFKKIAKVVGEEDSGLNQRESGYRVIKSIVSMQNDLRIPTSLREIGVERTTLKKLADECISKYPDYVRYNPRDAKEEDIVNIYEQMWEGRLV